MPTVLKFVAVVPLVIVMAGDCCPVTVAETLGAMAVPSVAVAILVIEPASRSACVVVALAVQVSVAFGARPVAGTAGHETEAILLSETEMTVADGSVVLPVFLTM